MHVAWPQAWSFLEVSNHRAAGLRCVQSHIKTIFFQNESRSSMQHVVRQTPIGQYYNYDSAAEAGSGMAVSATLGDHTLTPTEPSNGFVSPERR